MLNDFSMIVKKWDSPPNFCLL